MRDSSRRNFLATGLALPVAGLASTTSNAGEPATGFAPEAPGKVAYRTLGKTGMKVSTVGYGCMITSDPTVITRAVDMGITYFDSSRWYQTGNNERMVGQALGAKRKNIVLSTKVDAKDKAGAEKELEMSLKELNTDYLDVWHLHGKDTPEAITEELLDVQRAAKKAGKIRAIAVSTHQLPKVVDRIIEAKVEVVTAQYNFTSGADFTAAAKKLADAGVGLVAMKVIGGGMRGRAAGASKRKPEVAAAALKWVIKNPSFASTIPSMTDIEQLEQNFAAMSSKFEESDQKLLVARLEEIRPFYCRACGKCDGLCPQGLPVRDMIRFVSYTDGYGEYNLGREHFQRLSAEHQAVRCGDCSGCTIQCPNGVQVAKQMVRCQELYA